MTALLINDNDLGVEKETLLLTSFFFATKKSISSFPLLHMSVVSSAYLKSTIYNSFTSKTNSSFKFMKCLSHMSHDVFLVHIEKTWWQNTPLSESPSNAEPFEHSVLPTVVLTADSWSSYSLLTRSVRCFGNPIFVMIIHISLCLHSQMLLSSRWNTDTVAFDVPCTA